MTNGKLAAWGCALWFLSPVIALAVVLLVCLILQGLTDMGIVTPPNK